MKCVIFHKDVTIFDELAEKSHGQHRASHSPHKAAFPLKKDGRLGQAIEHTAVEDTRAELLEGELLPIIRELFQRKGVARMRLGLRVANQHTGMERGCRDLSE
jgi:hypothetical protein